MEVIMSFLHLLAGLYTSLSVDYICVLLSFSNCILPSTFIG